jgi:hypothetical protein
VLPMSKNATAPARELTIHSHPTTAGDRRRSQSSHQRFLSGGL